MPATATSTSTKPDIVTLSAGSVCVASTTLLVYTVRPVGRVTMETQCMPRTVKVSLTHMKHHRHTDGLGDSELKFSSTGL